MSFDFNTEAMASSIRAVGLINAPLVTQEPAGGWVIVSGYRRICAVRRLGWKEIPCRDISDQRLSPLERLQVNLYENLGTRPFNDVEKGMALARLAEHVSPADLLHQYMPLLGLPSHRPLLETLIRVTLEFPPEMLEALAQGSLSTASCRLMLDMSTKDRLAVFQVLGSMRFNRNQKQQFIELLSDICGCSEGSISGLLGEEAVRSIREDHRRNGPQKASALIRLLREKKFPLLTRAQQRFDRRVSALQLPKGTVIRHDRGFESPAYVLEVPFTNGEGLRRMLCEFTQKEGWEELGDPWEEET
jgi:ParB-like chromosome segregation protein Spo0J